MDKNGNVMDRYEQKPDSDNFSFLSLEKSVRKAT